MPNYPFSGIIPGDELSLAEKQAFRSDAINALMTRAINVKRLGNDPSEIAIRDILPLTDLAIAAGQWWQTPALVAGAVTIYVNNPMNAMRALSIYGVGIESAAPSCSVIWFRSGPAGATTKGIGNLEPLYTKMQPDGYLSKACMWDPLETVFIHVWARLTNAAGDRIPLRGAIAEPLGETISGPIV